MKKGKRISRKPEGIKIGDISGVSGNINIAGRDIKTHQSATTGISVAELQGLFDRLYAAIDSRPNTSSIKKEDLRSEVEEIQSVVTEAVQKKEEVDEGFLSKRFRNIARMAPDIVDVIVATLGSPLAGIGMTVKKIADKAKEQVA